MGVGWGGGGSIIWHPITSNRFLFVARHFDYGPSKMPLKICTVNFANSLSPFSTMKKVYAPEVETVKGLKQC